jgi:hypothetical protein
VDGTVIDENVLIAANQRNTHATPACALACIEYLLACRASDAIVLDAEYRILNKYAAKCNWSGQPGVGDEFFRWAHDNAARLDRPVVEEHEERGFIAFPDDADLETFDRDDRVFVAAALAANPNATVANAVDSDYADHAAALARYIDVIELCAHDGDMP